jgi:hypothetical protein
MTERVFSHYGHNGAVYNDLPDIKATARICANLLNEAQAEADRIIVSAKAEATRITNEAIAKIKNAGA